MNMNMRWVFIRFSQLQFLQFLLLWTYIRQSGVERVERKQRKQRKHDVIWHGDMGYQKLKNTCTCVHIWHHLAWGNWGIAPISNIIININTLIQSYKAGENMKNDSLHNVFNGFFKWKSRVCPSMGMSGMSIYKFCPFTDLQFFFSGSADSR